MTARLTDAELDAIRSRCQQRTDTAAAWADAQIRASRGETLEMSTLPAPISPAANVDVERLLDEVGELRRPLVISPCPHCSAPPCPTCFLCACRGEEATKAVATLRRELADARAEKERIAVDALTVDGESMENHAEVERLGAVLAEAKALAGFGVAQCDPKSAWRFAEIANLCRRGGR